MMSKGMTMARGAVWLVVGMAVVMSAGTAALGQRVPQRKGPPFKIEPLRKSVERPGKADSAAAAETPKATDASAGALAQRLAQGARRALANKEVEELARDVNTLLATLANDKGFARALPMRQGVGTWWP